jgi:hypothetical protein
VGQATSSSGNAALRDHKSARRISFARVDRRCPFPQAECWLPPSIEPLGTAGFAATIGLFSELNCWLVPSIHSGAEGTTRDVTNHEWRLGGLPLRQPIIWATRRTARSAPANQKNNLAVEAGK